MQKIKVLHLTSTRYGIGGVEKLLLDMSDKYDASKFDVSYCNLFCDLDGAGVFPTSLIEKGLDYHEIKGRRWLELPRMITRLIALLRKERFDICHLHMLRATIVGGFAAMFVRQTRTVLTKHYTDAISPYPTFIKKLDNYFTSRADQIVAISNYVRQDLVKVLSFREEEIAVVPNGTDLAEFDKSMEESALPPEIASLAEFTLGTVGSLTKRKGHEFLLLAMKDVSKRHPGVHLIVIGEGPERKNLDGLIGQLGIEERVTMLGFREDVASILRCVDLYVHPSIHEPFGIVLLEAMAARKCVIATSVEGVPEIVKPGVNGFLVPPGDAGNLAGAIAAALSDVPEMKRMGENGRKIVEKDFVIEKTVGKYEEIYTRTLEAH